MAFLIYEFFGEKDFWPFFFKIALKLAKSIRFPVHFFIDRLFGALVTSQSLSFGIFAKTLGYFCPFSGIYAEGENLG